MKFLSDILARAGLVVDGTVTLNSVANATTDTDRFIVVDSGVVKYRTGTQLLSDIGGISGNQTITLSGDATGSGTTSIAVTLANSGVTAGTYNNVTVDAKGRVTSATNVSYQSPLTNPITGTGTTGTLAKFSSSTGLTDSIIREISSSRLLIGTGTVDDTLSTIQTNGTIKAVGLTLDGAVGANTNLWIKSVTGYIGQIIYMNNSNMTFALRDNGTNWDVYSYVSGNTGQKFIVYASGTVKLPGYTSNGFLKTSASDGTLVVDTNSYLTGNQTITLSGHVTGSGTTSIATTIANGVVTNAMLVNSSFNIGTTSISLGRASASQTLTGVSIDGNSATTSQTNFSSLTVNSNSVLHAGNFTSYTIRWNSTSNYGSGLDNTTVVPNSVTLFDGYSAAVPGYPTAPNQWWVGALTIGDANRGFQIAGGYADADMYFRKGATTWGSWKKVWTDANLTNLNQLTNGPGYITGNQTITLSGDASGSGTTAITVTLANSGVTAGTYNNVTVNAKGIVTSGSNVSYQSPLTNPVTGTGTTNYLTKFTGTTTVGNSQIFDNGTLVGIGATSAYIDSNDKFIVAGGRLAVNVGAFSPAAFNRSNGGTIVDLLIGGYGKGYIGSNGTDITLVSYANLLVTATSVGIGVANPSTGDKVEIAGTLRVHTGNNWDAIQIYTDGANGYIQGLGDETGLRIRSQYGNIILADDRGNVGVGTTAPSHKFSVSRTTEAAAYQININNDGGISTGNYTGIRFSQSSNASTELGNIRLSYFTNGSTALSLGTRYATQAIYIDNTSDGKVGIATTSPDRLFTIAPASGDAYINLKRPVAASTQATLEFNTAGTNDWLIRTDDSSANLKFYSYGTSGYALILARSTGAATFSSSVTASSLIKSGGTSAQFLMADGSVSTNPGWITGYTETDTLATVTSRGNTTTGRINVRGAGNQSGGNILMGNTGNATAKWSYLTGAHYNADTQTQGFSLIGGYSDASGNRVVIGGSIYESNPATEIQFWTHTATTHNLGGTQRGVIDSNGNWGIGTNTSANKLQIGSVGSSGYSGNDLAIGNGTGVMAFYQTNTVSTWYTNTNFSLMPAGTGGVGNLAIGTATASNRLTVSGSADITGSLGIGLNNPGAILDVSHTAGTTNIIRVSNGAGNYRWRVDQNFAMIMTNASGTDTFSVTTAGALTATSVTETSTIKIKENIAPVTAALDKVDQLKPVSYNKKGSATKEIGLIAEDVFDVYPEFVLCDDNGEPVGIHYSRLTAVLIESVKELKNRITELENRN